MNRAGFFLHYFCMCLFKEPRKFFQQLFNHMLISSCISQIRKNQLLEHSQCIKELLTWQICKINYLGSVCCSKTLYTEYKSLRYSLLTLPHMYSSFRSSKPLCQRIWHPSPTCREQGLQEKRTKRLDLLPTEVNAKFPTTEVVNKVKQHLSDTELLKIRTHFSKIWLQFSCTSVSPCSRWPA